MNDKLKTIIVEDEKEGRDYLISIINNFCPSLTIVDVCSNANEAILSISEKAPDLVLMDIEMPGGNGFEVLGKIENRNFNIIFITAYDEYALKAIKFSAIDYLLKPIDKEELLAAIQRCNLVSKRDNMRITNLVQEKKDRISKFKKIILFNGDDYEIVELEKIIRCESNKNYTKFYFSNNKQITVSKTIKEFESLLEEFDFFRVNKFCLINIHHIKKVSKNDGGVLLMSDNETIPISPLFKAKLFSILDL